MSLPCTQWGTLSAHVPSGRQGGEECLCHVPSGGQWLMSVGAGEERRITAMYPVGDAQWLMYPMGDKGGEEDLCHVRSGGHSVTHVPSGG